MMVDVQRLRDSETAAMEDGEAFRAAVLAWCVSWHQLPAASLPDDDVALCRMLGYGRDLNAWKRVRAAGALRGFILCRDGRIYHRVVAEKAIEAWERKIAAQQSGRLGATKRWARRPPAGPDGHPMATPSDHDSRPIGAPMGLDSNGEGQGYGHGHEEEIEKESQVPLANQTEGGRAVARPSFEAAVAAVAALLERDLGAQDRVTLRGWMHDKRHDLRRHILPALQRQVELRGIADVAGKPLYLFNKQVAEFRLGRRVA